MLIRAVIDTNVLFEGLTTQSGACGLVVDAWLNGDFLACITTALEHEYRDVLARKLSAARWEEIAPVLGVLLSDAEWVTVYFSWRPVAADPGDDLLVDCAMNGRAYVVTNNLRDFRPAEQLLGRLGFRAISPESFAAKLAAQLPES